MLRSLNSCTKCRLSLQPYIWPEEWLGTNTRITRRHRTSNAGRTPHSTNQILDDLEPFKKSSPQTGRPAQYPRSRPSNRRGESSRRITHQVPNISLSKVVSYFEDHAYSWAVSNLTKQRLVSFGIPSRDAHKLLDGFIENVEAGLLSDPNGYAYYSLEKFSHPHDYDSIDVLYSTIFFSWAAKPANRVYIEQELAVDQRTVHLVQRLVEVTSRLYPADGFPKARAMHRKIILHVGPTNSGKTYHALRALAAAKTGVYAGPLRLLAHEIWDRLNTGQILPAGVEPESNDNGEVADPLKHARVCNMITGEERKLLSPDAPLISCTIEMMSFNTQYEVAVIDEIQMIGNRSRGGGWMNAVLGVCAKEVHLCGEETAVPIVKALLRHTGDEVVVKRYERLTPLVVEKESLGGDFSNVRVGDCIVAFSRNRIFELKRRVEAKTGMRCAVVYGRLPPEIRSEQATLFNNQASGYDVMIGSDAIGMGLNLKIKRVIFEALRKFEEGGMCLLSSSSIKQIAGRAGRFGLHDSDAGGTVTTLHAVDLADLANGLAKPNEPLPYGLIGYSSDLLTSTLSILPPGTSMMVALSAPQYIGRLPPFVRCATHERLSTVTSFIDSEWSHMDNEDKVLLLYAPVPWSDTGTMNIVAKMLIQHAQECSVDIASAIEGQGLMETLQFVEGMMKNQGKELAKFSSSSTTLIQLEAFHKILVFYKWMSFRNPIVYSDPTVTELKERSERVLNWTLEKMSPPKRQFQAAIPNPINENASPPRSSKPKHAPKEDEQTMPYADASRSYNDVNLLPLQLAA
ncbi:hypothetical protein GALMADRAFT_240629 [Galerina marginata CBS 339.88]|uniref:RNA helicase n=1 Tax=Galerina marginata (strain CBS 339.88) TaxID=685588 RepID=A0A067TG42_GALM3|nr:hypothetical protein GALMADRAFT_240629 [Galerina marginata CBS 339.88]